MSRSVYVYVVLDRFADDEVRACFTVKYEMIAWLRRNQVCDRDPRAHWIVYRMKANPPPTATWRVELDVDELLRGDCSVMTEQRTGSTKIVDCAGVQIGDGNIQTNSWQT